jgi:RimJ/RimL family protein N-acetyltransferase
MSDGHEPTYIERVRFELTRNPREFVARAGELLERRIEENVLATVTYDVLAGRRFDSPPLFGLGLDSEDRVSWIAVRTPPLPMLASELGAADAPELIDVWLDEDPDVPGVNALPATCRAIADAWSARTGGSSMCRIRMAMHQLDRVIDPPRPAAGDLRLAVAADGPLLVEWWHAFARDARVSAVRVAPAVQSRIQQSRLFIWEDGRPVSMVGVNGPLAGVVRIGPVYTPEALRRRGYAGTAVAAASRRALDGDATRCALFTDLSNPTANKIYAEVGYRRFADWEEHVFRRR